MDNESKIKEVSAALGHERVVHILHTPGGKRLAFYSRRALEEYRDMFTQAKVTVVTLDEWKKGIYE